MLARQDYGDIMDGLRNGRICVTTGDLISSLDVVAKGSGRGRNDVEIEITFSPLQGTNANGDRPEVRRVDLIVGQITGPNPNLDADTNPTTSVVARFGPSDWRRQGDQYVIRHTLRNVESDMYARVRGTNTDEAEPLADGRENPWSDLWFYSNPVFVRVR